MSELSKVFEALGVPDPEGWARSQEEEGVPQLHRLLFLRQCWREVVDEGERDWIERAVAAWRDTPDEPYAANGRAIEAMLAKGVDPAHIVDLVRTTQAEMLQSVCQVLDEPRPEEDGEIFESIGWSLVVTDEDFEPTSLEIGELHESVLETDPTGREMRPRELP